MNIDRENDLTIKYAARVVNETNAAAGDFGHIQFILRDLINETEKDPDEP